MDYNNVVKLMDSKELKDKMYDVVSLLSRRIENNEITKFKISDNTYPASHFIEICSSRLSFMKKKKSKVPAGYEETIDLLKKFNGTIRHGSMLTKNNENFVLYFQEGLNRLIALHYSEYFEPIVLQAKNAVP